MVSVDLFFLFADCQDPGFYTRFFTLFIAFHSRYDILILIFSFLIYSFQASPHKDCEIWGAKTQI